MLFQNPSYHRSSPASRILATAIEASASHPQLLDRPCQPWPASVNGRESLSSDSGVALSGRAKTSSAAGSVACSTDNRHIWRLFSVDCQASPSSPAVSCGPCCHPETAPSLSSAGPDYDPYTVEEKRRVSEAGRIGPCHDRL